ncbi:MAG: hypothetical protein IPJ34_25250 [Myxococcales bacterium]|nr:hypothetical protein [Myxococcales bacterium]
MTTPLGLFWLARLLFVGSFGLFASTGVGFMAAVRGPQPGVQAMLVVLATGWFFLPFLGVLTRSAETCRVELFVTDEGAKLAFPSLNAASTLDWVRARRFGGRLLVTIAGQTCALRDVDEDVADRLAACVDPERLPGPSTSFEAPVGSLVSIMSTPRPSLTIRGWLAVKPYWWALPLLLLVGALVMANLPRERAGFAVPTVRLATLCALVAAASVVQDAAYGVARALDGVTGRRARGQQLSVTRRGVHLRTADEEIEATFDAVTAVALLRGGLAISLGSDVLVAHADDATARQMVDVVLERIGDRATRYLA